MSQAQEDEAVRQRTEKAFLAAGGTQDELLVNNILSAIQGQFAASTPFNNERKRLLTEQLKSIIAKGNVNFARINKSNKGLIRNFFGLHETVISNNKPFIIFRNTKPNPIISQVAQQPITTTPPTDESQFLHAPTDTFEIIGVQGIAPVSGGSGSFPKLFNLKLEQSSYSEGGTIRIRVSAFLITPFQSGSADAQLLARFSTPSGQLKKQVSKNINFTPNSPQQRQVDIITTVSDIDIRRISVSVIEKNELAINSLNFTIERAGVIPPPPPPPPPVGTGRLEGFVQLDTCKINFVLTESNLVILRNRYTVVITNPSTEKGTTSVQEVLARIEAGCDVPPPPSPVGGEERLLEKIAIGAIVAGGLAMLLKGKKV